MKRAYFVTGPESSGTRMMMQALGSVGVWGDDGHVQSLDDLRFGACNHTPIAFRRSVPHGGAWPPLYELVLKMEAAGYDVQVLIILRDREATAQSQIHHEHANSLEDARQRISMAVRHIFGNLPRRVLRRAEIISYELFVLSADVRRATFRSLALSPPNMTFYDGNAKYQGDR